MKTTIDIADALLEEARRVAGREGTTLKNVLERSLRQFLEAEKKRGRTFRLKDGSVGGRGVQAGIREGDWRQIRSLVYEGRGG